MSITDNNRLYTGRSMAGTFRCGDLLKVETVSFGDLSPGDVVVYREATGTGQMDVVHRVMGVGPNGFVLMGDNNRCEDQTLLTETNLVGKVSGLTRNGKTIPVRGRWLGLMHARARHAWIDLRQTLDGRVRRIGRKVYHRSRGSRLIALVWRPTITKIQLMTGDNLLVKYVCGHRTVATHRVDGGRFACCKPFDLLLCRSNRPKGGP